jgi:hypothetical protein
MANDSAQLNAAIDALTEQCIKCDDPSHRCARGEQRLDELAKLSQTLGFGY